MSAPERWLKKMRPSLKKRRPELATLLAEGGWTIATDGWSLVAVRGRQPGLPATPGPVACLEPESDPLGTWSLESLRRWCGPVEWPENKTEVCPSCEGAGAKEHECDCDLCDLNGALVSCGECDGRKGFEQWAYPEARPARFRGKVYDLAKLACLLDVVEADAVTLYPRQGPMLLGVAGDVRFVLAGMRGDVDAPDSEPEP